LTTASILVVLTRNTFFAILQTALFIRVTIDVQTVAILNSDLTTALELIVLTRNASMTIFQT